VVFSRYCGFLHHDLTEILLKVVLITIDQTKPNQTKPIGKITNESSDRLLRIMLSDIGKH
jgi:hypothetical protein